MNCRVLRALGSASFLLACAGCGSGGSSSPSPAPTPAPAPTPGGTPAPAPVPAAFIDSDRGPITTGPAGNGSKPNIVWIVADDLRPELGAYGNKAVKTPNIDALAAQGAVFENAFVSEAICAPSRATIMSGLRPDTTRITGATDTLDVLAPSAITIGDVFKAAGYVTERIGKVYHTFAPGDDANAWIELPPPRLVAPVPSNPPTTMRWPDRITTADYQDSLAVADELKRLAKTPQNPFFLALGHFRPHTPEICPSEDWDKYDPANFPSPQNPSGQLGAFSWSLVNAEIFHYFDYRPFAPTLPPEKGREFTWAYYACVSSLDYNVGIVMQALKDSGVADNTIVVFLGDNGYKLGDHKFYNKQSNADLDIRIPLIMVAPGRIAAGTRVKGIVESTDIFPTLADMAGLSTPTAVEGISFTTLFTQPNRNWKPAAFAQYPRDAWLTEGNGALMGYTVRTANYRYTAWVRQTTKAVVARELYDLVNDREESTNVAKDARYAAVVNSLESMRLAGWRPIRDKLISG